MKQNVGVVVLAGGNSSRMKYPKLFLEWNGKSFLHTLAETYQRAGIATGVAVVNSNFCGEKWQLQLEPVKSIFKIVENPDLSMGRFHSLKSGIAWLQHLDFCFIQSVDSPCINTNTLEQLWQVRNSQGYISPSFMGRRGHPILISKKITEQIITAEDKETNLKEFLTQFPRREIEIKDPEILQNINTLEDYQRLLAQGQN